MTGSNIRGSETRHDATVMDVARTLKRQIALGHSAQAIRSALWSPDCVLVDHEGHVRQGLKEIEAWAAQWKREYRMEMVTYGEPFVGASSFAMQLMMKARRLSDESIEEISQISVYSVTDGRVTRETFLRGGTL